MLRSFFRFYGSKWRSTARGMYPRPIHDVIIEPFAGSAGYSLHYPERQVILIERDPTIASIWRFLIGATPGDIRSIPLVDDVDSLPADLPHGAQALVGFSMNAATTGPRRTLSASARRLRELGRKFYGWTAEQRERVALQVAAIKHWLIIEGDYTKAAHVLATWFIDPPYEQTGGHYRFGSSRLNYSALAAWCLERIGQPIVCEAPGARWLPFRDIGAVKSGPRSRTAREALWP